MSARIPTTDEVRMAFGDIHCPDPDDPAHAHGCPADECFHRWLAEVERAAAEKAWLQGHEAGRDYQGDGWNCDVHDPQDDNPYREDAR